ncbi:hypothetical protein U1Q18_052726 [Sarracenia purpurea var. burkii]
MLNKEGKFLTSSFKLKSHPHHIIIITMRLARTMYSNNKKKLFIDMCKCIYKLRESQQSLNFERRSGQLFLEGRFLKNILGKINNPRSFN